MTGKSNKWRFAIIVGSIKHKKKQALDAIMRETILDAAVDILRTCGTKALTMDKVAAFAKIAKGTVYLYFKNKDELLKELVLKIKKPMFEEFIRIKEMNISAPEKIEKIFYYMLNNIEKNLSFVRVIIPAIDASENVKIFMRKDDEEAIQVFAGILQDGIKNEALSIENPEYAAKMIFACLIYMIRERGDGIVKYMSVKKEVESFMRVFNSALK